MASFKVRRKTLAQGGIQVGGGGSTQSEVLFGSVTYNTASAASAAIVSSSVSVAGLNAGAQVFVTATSAPSGLFLQAASATAAGALSASYFNAGTASVPSAPLTLMYLAVA